MERAHPANLALSLLLVTMPAWAGEAGASDDSPGPQMSREQMEEFLLNAKIVKHKALNIGVTNSRVATLTLGDLTHDAHVQTVEIRKAEFKGERGTEFNFRDSYRYNIAAYLLDKLMELNAIPVSVERRLGGKTAAFTWWVDDPMMTEMERINQKINPPDVAVWNGQMHLLRVFDQLIHNVDRNLRNMVISQDWNLWMIDHTRAFRLHTKLREPGNLVKCDRHLLQALRTLTEDTVKSATKGYLRPAEVKALLKRRDVIVAFFDAEVAKQGEAEVLYDVVRN